MAQQNSTDSSKSKTDSSQVKKDSTEFTPLELHNISNLLIEVDYRRTQSLSNSNQIGLYKSVITDYQTNEAVYKAREVNTESMIKIYQEELKKGKFDKFWYGFPVGVIATVLIVLSVK